MLEDNNSTLTLISSETLYESNKHFLLLVSNFNMQKLILPYINTAAFKIFFVS